jgi:hypothetical protein
MAPRQSTWIATKISCMRGETEKRWRELCEQAVKEQDPEKIMKLIGEVNQLLENNEEHLPRKPAA